MSNSNFPKDELPKLKKSLKSFILEEDAKVIDKSASKIALISSFIAASFLLNIDNANAKGHHNHSEHSNKAFYKGNKEELLNLEDDKRTVTVNEAGRDFSVDVDGKSTMAVHGNHYNHADGGGKS